MLSRAIAATQTARNALGAQAGALHLFGHSLGGLLSATWMGRGGPAVESATLANPSIGGGAPSFVSITPIDWAAAAPAARAPCCSPGQRRMRRRPSQSASTAR
jgi:alpha-beta hydrolase superfamily lysophospholipase